MKTEHESTSFPGVSAVSIVEMERLRFKELLVSNPNYFGSLGQSTFPVVKKMASNRTYEELTCVGYNPEKKLLEATIAVKLPYGYGGNLCREGTTEYVRFFVNDGSGWEDAGLAGVNVHDIPTAPDCAHQENKPLLYVASLAFSPKTRCCNHPVLPKVHAILSWQYVPPAGPSHVGWTPPWGNTLECNIQIRPHPWNLLCMIEAINESIPQKVKIPPMLEPAKLLPIPVPDPPPYTLAELSGLHRDEKAQAPVAPHRFGFGDLHTAMGPGGFDQAIVSAKSAEWKALGLDWAAAVAALNEVNADVSYEELTCLGLDDNLERLVATFRIKRPQGYLGDLCHAGSTEYVAFWADWDNACKWTYLGTVKVNVHDIAGIPEGGLCYSAILPVDLTYHRRSCSSPKIGRVRAVLSWYQSPSTMNPDTLNYWGNRLDAHVQINPGDVVEPGKPLARIRNLGGVAMEDIDTLASGMTNPGDIRFAHDHWATADGWGHGRSCPFGGMVQVEGDFYLGYYYRVQARKAADPGVLRTLDQDFYVERNFVGFDHQVATGGWFKYLDPVQEFDRMLAVWSTTDDDLWEIHLDIATVPNDAGIIAGSPWYRLQLDNTGPASPAALSPGIDIHITNGGDCKDVSQADIIKGVFIADDVHFGGWSLSTEPNTAGTPSNQPQASPLMANTDPAPGPIGHGWTLNTGSPLAMKPCGYVVRLDVSDRSIVNSVPGQHHANHMEVGFCLRPKA